jgi:hypothetical protein
VVCQESPWCFQIEGDKTRVLTAQEIDKDQATVIHTADLAIEDGIGNTQALRQSRGQWIKMPEALARH